MTIYSIEFQKHKAFYDFFNSEKCVDDFLRNAKSKFRAGGKKWVKCSFKIENIQNSPHKDLRPIINSRYWTTPPYEWVYFNDFIFYGLRQNILGRVIINGICGSSFQAICFVVIENVRQWCWSCYLSWMADFINFEVSVEDEVQKEENQVSDSDLDSLSSFIIKRETGWC